MSTQHRVDQDGRVIGQLDNIEQWDAVIPRVRGERLGGEKLVDLKLVWALPLEEPL